MVVTLSFIGVMLLTSLNIKWSTGDKKLILNLQVQKFTERSIYYKSLFMHYDKSKLGFTAVHVHCGYLSFQCVTVIIKGMNNVSDNSSQWEECCSFWSPNVAQFLE